VIDSTPPVFTSIPAGATLECGVVPPPAAGVIAVDNCDPAVEVTSSGMTPVVGSCAGGYQAVRTWTATDSCGNTTEVAQALTLVDTTRPTLSAPPPITFECNTTGGVSASDPQLQAWLGSSIASDSCSDLTLSDDSPVLFPVGTTTVTFTATDDCGNSETRFSTVTVVDTAPPAVVCSAARVTPSGVNSLLDHGEEEWLVVQYSASDACTAVTTFGTIDLVSGSGGPQLDDSCDAIPVPSGQVIDVECGNARCEVEWAGNGLGQGALLRNSSGSAELLVAAQDTNGNIAICTVDLCSAGDDDRDDAQRPDLSGSGGDSDQNLTHGNTGPQASGSQNSDDATVDRDEKGPEQKSDDSRTPRSVRGRRGP